MAQFKVVADFVFEADSIVDAFEVLSTHFKTLSEEGESNTIKLGKITIDKIGDENV